jgi:hypothetical protein
MASGIVFMQWDNYETASGQPVFFQRQELTFNSRQDRLHKLSSGDRLWLVSRCPSDQQYYFIAVFQVASQKHNTPGTREAEYGEYAIVADRAQSHDLGKRFPAEGLLRALEFDSLKPIKYGANIGQSLQTLRLLNAEDAQVLTEQLQRLLEGRGVAPDAPFGLWTKCDRIFADYFLKNWEQRKEPLAFLLYDPPPVLQPQSPIFIHSNKHLRLVARFVSGHFVAGHKFTADKEERIAERERVWTTYRAKTIDPPTKAEFDAFWEKQHGVRALLIMENVLPVPEPVPFKLYGRALEWGYPTGVGYRYMSFSQSLLLLRTAQTGDAARRPVQAGNRG